jgi:hypothetical protein
MCVQLHNGDWSRYQIDLKLSWLSKKFETFLEETVELMILNCHTNRKVSQQLLNRILLMIIESTNLVLKSICDSYLNEVKICFSHHSLKWFDLLGSENWQNFDQRKLTSIWIRWYLSLKMSSFIVVLWIKTFKREKKLLHLDLNSTQLLSFIIECVNE